jgi:hypothetical protein
MPIEEVTDSDRLMFREQILLSEHHKRYDCMKKLLAIGLAALGLTAFTPQPAKAGVTFGFSFGPGYYYPGYYPDYYYGPSYYYYRPYYYRSWYYHPYRYRHYHHRWHHWH